MPITLYPLNRRRFMAGTLAGVVPLLFNPAWAMGAGTSSRDVWAFLSDTHIAGDRNKKRGKHLIKPVEHLAKVRTDVLSGEIGKPDGVIVCGDCALLYGLPEDYKTLIEEFAPFREKGLPVHFVMGNHDNRETFLNAIAKSNEQKKPQKIPHRLYSIVETPKANFFLLDSLNKTDKPDGLLGSEQLQWLTDELDSRKDRPAIIVAHHDPDYPDRVARKPKTLQDTAALFDIIRQRRQVKAYIYGHSHVWETRSLNGIHTINIPSTLGSDADSTQPSGWVLLELKDNGMLLTLRSIDKKHSKHNEKFDLDWRKESRPTRRIL